MTDLLIWGGPVAQSTLGPLANPDAWPRPTQIVTFNQGPDGGIGSSSFQLLANSFKDSNGRILPNLLASIGAKRSDYDKVSIAGFSAFHGLASDLLGADGDDIDAAVLLDACFTGIPASPKPGYVSYGERAAMGERLMVYTSSWGGGFGSGNAKCPGCPDYSTGSDAVRASFMAAAAGVGCSPSDYTPPDTVPQPAEAFRCSSLIWLDYHDAYSHGQHPIVLGPDVLKTFLLPYLSNPYTFLGWSSVVPWLAGAAGVAAGIVAGRYIYERYVR
jgi:hypothetical protein